MGEDLTVISGTRSEHGNGQKQAGSGGRARLPRRLGTSHEGRRPSEGVRGLLRACSAALHDGRIVLHLKRTKRHGMLGGGVVVAHLDEVSAKNSLMVVPARYLIVLPSRVAS